MVQLEEVEDPELDQAQPGPIPDSAYDSADFVDTDSELSDEDDDDELYAPPPETLTDRVLALRDILPPPFRRRIQSTFSTSTSLVKSGAWWGGKSLWVLSTGAMMLMVPFAIAFVEEQEIVAQEKEMKAREETGGVVTPGVSQGGVGAQGRAL